MFRITAALMDASHCRLIHQWGSGLEGVDVAAAQSRGIWVASVPTTGSNADSEAKVGASLPPGIRELDEPRLGGERHPDRLECMVFDRHRVVEERSHRRAGVPRPRPDKSAFTLRSASPLA